MLVFPVVGSRLPTITRTTHDRGYLTYIANAAKPDESGSGTCDPLRRREEEEEVEAVRVGKKEGSLFSVAAMMLGAVRPVWP